MNESAWYLRLVSICLLFVLPLVQGVDVRVQKTPCSCMFPNGTRIDLSPSAHNSAFISASYERWHRRVYQRTFYYHPCYDIVINMTKRYPEAPNTCTKPASLFRHVSSWQETDSDTLRKIEDSSDYIGTSNYVEIATDGSYIIYYNPPSRNTVHLVCADTDDQLDVKDLTDPSALPSTALDLAVDLRSDGCENGLTKEDTQDRAKWRKASRKADHGKSRDNAR